jgi:putative OPT family oligopeptide transporter
VERTDRDLPMNLVMGGLVVVALATWAFFRFGVMGNEVRANTLSLIALGVVIIISFLFTTVAARAIATVGTNPVSGMTLMTLILTSVFMVQAGLSGKSGMLAALLIGGVVCTALSMAGGLITDLKIGYWLGSTPAVQQRAKFLGTIVAAAAVGGVILLLNQAYGFVPSADHPADKVFAAPQANAMAAVIASVMQSGHAPWFLYGIGAVVAVIVQMLGISALAFALGMYLPIELNTPILAGAIVAWLVKRKSGNPTLERARGNRGTLIASGFIAGGGDRGRVRRRHPFRRRRHRAQSGVRDRQRRRCRKLDRPCRLRGAGRLPLLGRQARDRGRGGRPRDHSLKNGTLPLFRRRSWRERRRRPARATPVAR